MKRSIRACLFLLLFVTGGSGGVSAATRPEYLEDGSIRLWDRTFYTKNQFIAYASPWCANATNGLLVGTDLIDSIRLWPDTFPGNVVFLSKVPDVPPSTYGCGVYRYNALGYGNYYNGRPQKPIPSVQVGVMKDMKFNFSVSHSGPGAYNILQEFFLTLEAGKFKYRMAEVGFFHHADPATVAYAKSGRSFGSYVDAGKTEWQVYKRGRFIMLLPKSGDLDRGTINLREILAFLKQRGLVKDEWWFNGMALGVEPITGASKFEVQDWSVELP